MPKSSKKRVAKEMVGTVVSDKMEKTIVVRVNRLAVHAVFKKAVRRFNRFKAHDEKNSAKIGDVVKIREARPLSGDKRWVLVKIVGKGE